MGADGFVGECPIELLTIAADEICLRIHLDCLRLLL